LYLIILKKNLSKKGYTAKWKILELNSNYGQFAFDDFISREAKRSQMICLPTIGFRPIIKPEVVV